MKRILIAATLALAGAAALPAYANPHVDFQIVIGNAPPPPRHEVVPPPRPHQVWVPGYWSWSGHRHVWVAGHWERARVGQHFRAPHWQRVHNGWHFDRGGWERKPHDRHPSEKRHDKRHDNRHGGHDYRGPHR